MNFQSKSISPAYTARNLPGDGAWFWLYVVSSGAPYNYARQVFFHASWDRMAAVTIDLKCCMVITRINTVVAGRGIAGRSENYLLYAPAVEHLK